MTTNGPSDPPTAAEEPGTEVVSKAEIIRLHPKRKSRTAAAALLLLVLVGVLGAIAVIEFAPKAADTPHGPTGPPVVDTTNKIRIGTVTVGYGCVPATPLPGWRFCQGAVPLTISSPPSSRYVSVFFAYPDSTSFFHGETLVVAGRTGYTVNVVNAYFARCVPSVSTTIILRNGRDGVGNTPVLARIPVTLSLKSC